LPTEATARCGTLLPRTLVSLPGHGSDALGALDRIDVDATEPDAVSPSCSAASIPGSSVRRVTAFRPVSVASATQSGAGVILVEPVS
jgi:hypothetical protein